MNPRAPRGRRLTMLAAFGVLSVAVFAYLFVLAGGRVPLGEPYRVTAALADGFALERHAEVRAAGVRVGRVGEIRADGATSLVTLELDSDHAPVYRNARVRLRARTLIGENYVDLVPGGPPAAPVPAGGCLGLEQSDESVQFDQILSTLDAETRRAVRTNLRGLGRGVVGRSSDVNALFDRLDATTRDGVTVLGAVHAQRHELARVIDDTATVLQAVSQREDALRGLITDARRVAGAAASRDGQLRRALRELPGTLGEATEAIEELERLAQTGRPAISDLTDAVAALGPAASELTPAAAGARDLLTRIPRLSRRLDPLLDAARTLGSDGLPAVRELLPTIRQLQPLAAHLRPYERELGAFTGNVAAAFGAVDATGHMARTQLVFDEDTLFSVPPEYDRALEALRNAGLVTVPQDTGFNAYPRPGTLDHPASFEGSYPRVGGPPGN